MHVVGHKIVPCKFAIFDLELKQLIRQERYVIAPWQWTVKVMAPNSFGFEWQRYCHVISDASLTGWRHMVSEKAVW